MHEDSWRDREAVLAAVQSWSEATGVPVVLVLGGEMVNVLQTVGDAQAAERLLHRAAASMAHGVAQRQIG